MKQDYCDEPLFIYTSLLDIRSHDICLHLLQEMSGLCYFMLDQSRKDAEYYMENAFTTYLVFFYEFILEIHF